MLTQEHLPVLKAARALFRADKADYICIAVGRVCCLAYPEYIPDSIIALNMMQRARLEDKITSYIVSELGDHFTLSTWMFQEVTGVDPYSPEAGEAPEQYQAWLIGVHNTVRMARLAWLDRIIDNLENS